VPRVRGGSVLSGEDSFEEFVRAVAEAFGEDVNRVFEECEGGECGECIRFKMEYYFYR